MFYINDLVDDRGSAPGTTPAAPAGEAAIFAGPQRLEMRAKPPHL